MFPVHFCKLVRLITLSVMPSLFDRHSKKHQDHHITTSTLAKQKTPFFYTKIVPVIHKVIGGVQAILFSYENPILGHCFAVSKIVFGAKLTQSF